MNSRSSSSSPASRNEPASSAPPSSSSEAISRRPSSSSARAIRRPASPATSITSAPASRSASTRAGRRPAAAITITGASSIEPTSRESSGSRARRVEDDPRRLAPCSGVDPAGGEQRVVGERGPDPDRDRVGSARQRWTSARLAAPRDPLRVAGRGGGEAVEAQRRLQHHQRPAGAGVLAERLVQQPRRGRLGAVGELDLDPAVAQDPRAAPDAFSVGSSEAITTRAIPAARIASVQGGWRP